MRAAQARGGTLPRAGGARDRPGDDRDDLPRLRCRGASSRPRLPRVRPALPAAGLGRARRRRRSGTSRRRSPARRSTTPGWRPASSRPIGITNQRETVCVWDPATGEPLHRAIVWQDRRTAARCDELRAAGHEALVRERTGLVLDPYFSATKIEWLLEHVDGLRERARDGRAVFGTIDALARLEAHRRARHRPLERVAHAALRPRARGAWDDELLRAASACPSARCPRCARRSASSAARPDALPATTVPVAGIAGDQQAALFGQACLDPGQAKNTYGTGSFVLVNTGDEPPPVAPPGLLATVAWGIGAAHGLRARGGDLRHRRGGAVAARRPGDHRARRPRPRRWRRR